MRKVWSLAVLPIATCGWLLFLDSVSAYAQSHPDDSCWRALDGGVEYPSTTADNVSAFAVYNGDLIVGGLFRSAGGVSANSVARWDGMSWHPMGDGIDDWHYSLLYDQVNCLALHEGSLFAGGNFCNYDSNSYLGFVARWNGASWRSVCGGSGDGFGESGCLNEAVYTLESFGGSLYAGSGSMYSVARWDGSSWRRPGYPSLFSLGGTVRALEVFDNKLFAGGSFSTLNNGYPYVDIVGCDASGFDFIPRPGDSSSNYRYPIALCLYNRQLIAPWQDGLGNRLYAWDDTTWIPFSPYFNDRIVALTVHDGKLIAGGEFTMVGDVPAAYIAEWTGERWEPLGSGVNNRVLSLTSWNGSLFAGGYFTEAGGQTVNYVAQWTRAKLLRVLDADKNPLPNRRFHFIRVTDNRPRYDEDTLGTFVTDSLGRLPMFVTGDTAYTLPLEVGGATVAVGDRIKIARQVYSEEAVRHSGTKYSIHLDNADIVFDYNHYDLVFDTMALGDQNIVLNHTEVRYNLVVSLEWDAAELYVDGLRKDFRQMSNYLYDVTDGQVRLDTVLILDDAALWRYADVRIRASNVHNPNASVRGMHHRHWYPINMPRKWFGNPDAGRLFSYLVHPLMDELSDNYRTLAHEFGHYALGFHDEYECVNAIGIPIACCVPDPIGAFGFMEWQYDREYSLPGSSEMSSECAYQVGFCRGTLQWFKNGMSCWDQFELLMEDTIDGLHVPILKPHMSDSTERITGAINYFPGPNNDLYDLDYDVGRLVRFTSPILPPSPNVRSVRVRVNGVPAGGAAVSTEQVATGWIIDQGKTTDDGWIWALGVDVTQDIIEASGYGFAEVPPGKAAASRRVADRVWLSGSSTATADDSIVVEMNPVDGNFPFICEGRLVGSSWEYYLTAEFLLNAPPSISVSPSSGAGSYAFNPTYQGYFVLLPEDTALEGSATVRAVDNSAAPFSFPTRFKRIEIDTVDYLSHLIGPGGDIIVRLDTANSAVQSLLVLSSPYPVPLSGLPINATQVGQAHSLSIEPNADLQGMNTIRLYYAETDLTPISGFSADEEALQIHRWDSTTYQWLPLTSLVDTALNFVSAAITETGIYTLFAVQYPTDVDEGEPQGSLPYRFELSQNYPNPFNPVTTIEYSLPERSYVTIEVYNVLGQKVRTLVDREESAGSYTITWDGMSSAGRPVSAGVYLYRFQAGDYVEMKKMILLK